MKFVDKQMALKLKEKGFDRPCFGWYDGKLDIDKLHLNVAPKNNCTYKDLLDYAKDINDIIDAPTIEQTLEWLREEKKIHISINVLSSMNKNFMCKQESRLIFDVRVAYFKEEVFNYYDLDEPYFKYEDACIAGIEYVINNLI